MSKELELYKAFIDGLVERKDSMTALWVKGDGFPKRRRPVADGFFARRNLRRRHDHRSG